MSAEFQNTATTESEPASTLAAVPVFFLARRILSRGWSLGVAALSVALPWMEYASRSLTEPLLLRIMRLLLPQETI